jgi:phage host-nuclease inhibitor protein Gam
MYISHFLMSEPNIDLSEEQLNKQIEQWEKEIAALETKIQQYRKLIRDKRQANPKTRECSHGVVLSRQVCHSCVWGEPWAIGNLQ